MENPSLCRYPRGGFSFTPRGRMQDDLAAGQKAGFHQINRGLGDEPGPPNGRGLAGAGKRGTLTQPHHPPKQREYQDAGGAPTGKACDVRHKKGVPAKTLHAVFQRLVDEKVEKHKRTNEDGTSEEYDITAELYWSRKTPKDFDVLLVDE